ncbi:NADH-ubiquinone oxidoreductase mlrq subunit, putative [Pediculus humanus corporis]|uniref:NADH-ubiquinone oxidoreductase mlrq subunit, putative n=1 Tax=Pediculus humanus subsp. corporis TaxID=121224 RepID=E0VKA4_PEDHC|nr:NADH-ubiquinone oxidoreductase mlrq subunit, putative [Pediculus humanus corporis]EEB13810.1 NADH-ubiquinone oxidoreductase mlrq subunit, putative [Pediculus humanus corporis]
MVMPGMTWKTLKKNPSLIPLFAVLGLGLGGAIFYPLRCAIKSPDVTWNRIKNPEPWNEYENKDYKFYKTKEQEKIFKQ